MKKVLILTYYFPPANSVAGFRSYSWARYFHERGIRPVVVTRHWTGRERSWIDLLAADSTEPQFSSHEHYDLIQLPTRDLLLIRLFRSNILRLYPFRKLCYFVLAILGYFNLFSDAYSSFIGFLRGHLKENKYDLILATSPPLNIVRLAHVLGREYDIPYVVDFRDLWNNDYLREGYKPKGSDAIMENLMVFWLRRWLENSLFVISVSQPIADFLGKVCEHEREVVLNGFEQDLFEKLIRERPVAFTLTLAGTYYAQQGLDLLLQGLVDFLKGKHPESVHIKLIGVSANPSVGEKFKKKLPVEFCHWQDRCESQNAVQEILNSHVLLHSAWIGYSGIYTTKLFDFIASGNTVVLAPGDGDVMTELVKETGSGFSVYNTQELTRLLNDLYREWAENGDLNLRKNSAVYKYSRRNQALHLADRINEYLAAQIPSEHGTKRILVATYYFPPCLGVPAYRPLSWAKNFCHLGFDTTVITRHWTGKELKWSDYTNPNRSSSVFRREIGYKVIYMPTFQRRWVQWIDKNSISRYFLSRILNFISLVRGEINPEIDAFNSLKRAVVAQLRKSHFDFVLITSPPPNIARLAPLVKRYSAALVILDFRDLWNNSILKIDYRPNYKQKVFDAVNRFYHKSWLKDVDLVTIVSPPFREVLGNLTASKIELVYNGYEESEFRSYSKRNESFFRFSIIGTIYPEQNLSIMLDGLKKFLAGKSPGEVIIRYVGAGQFPDVERQIQDSIPQAFLEIYPKVSKTEAIRYTLDSEVLFYPGWKGSRGILSTKIFDYMASGNRVILAPGDHDIIDEFLRCSGVGVSVDSVDEFCDTMQGWFQEWRVLNRLDIDANFEFISGFSRENQARVLSRLIKGLAEGTYSQAR